MKKKEEKKEENQDNLKNDGFQDNNKSSQKLLKKIVFTSVQAILVKILFEDDFINFVNVFMVDLIGCKSVLVSYYQLQSYCSPGNKSHSFKYI